MSCYRASRWGRQWEDAVPPTSKRPSTGERRRASSTAAEHGRTSRSLAASVAEGKMKIFRFTLMDL
jgi:hypothetical protein